MGVPDRKGPQKPVMPFAETWVKADATPHELDRFVTWKRQCVKFYDDQRAWRGKVREVGSFLKASREGLTRFWFPVFIDTRGRWYYRGTPNPQGSDLAKAVIHFADKKPLGATGVHWLKVHIANSLGFDKERLEARAAWVDANWEALERALDAPGDYADVWGKDNPWCAYAAVWELREAYRSGNPATYETGVPVHMDATCSGLQHFAAMLRDPVGAECVNLIDLGAGHGPKQDIYSKVSTNALASMKRDLESTDEDVAQMALFWTTVGIPRSMAKKPVMTYVYGATLLGTAQYVLDYLNEEMSEHSLPPGARGVDYGMYAARKLFSGIAQTVPAAASAMQWLRRTAQDTPRGQRMEWTAPNGFKVQHDYQDFEEVRVSLRSCGTTKAIVRNYNDDTQPHRMQNAIAPNFVHALDAAHLSLTSLRMAENGLSMVAIHDSFGSHACDVARMQQLTREAFVSMYSDKDLLVNYLWEIGGVGETPAKGTFDLKHILDSEFFFC